MHANLALRQLHAISSSAEHDMNNKSFNIQGHMDSVKISILFQEVDFLVPAFIPRIPDTHMQDKHTSLVLWYRSLFLTYVDLSHPFFLHAHKTYGSFSHQVQRLSSTPALYLLWRISTVLPSCSSLYFYNNVGSFKPEFWAWSVYTYQTTYVYIYALGRSFYHTENSSCTQ